VVSTKMAVFLKLVLAQGICGYVKSCYEMSELLCSLTLCDSLKQVWANFPVGLSH
jgi:hypothetical protein